MQEAITLTDGLKNELILWVLGALVLAPGVVQKCISIWQMLRGKKDETVSRHEFNSLCDQVQDLKESSITKDEFAGIKEDLKELKDEYKQQNKTLFNLSKDISELIGQAKAKHA